jgi:hypothetical protein
LSVFEQTLWGNAPRQQYIKQEKSTKVAYKQPNKKLGSKERKQQAAPQAKREEKGNYKVSIHCKMNR